MRKALATAVCMLVFTTNGEPLPELEPDVARLPRCESEPFASVRGWSRFTVPDNGVRLRIPPKFVEAPQPQSVHGGYAWKNGERRLQALYGHWSLFSFRSAKSNCLLRMRSINVVINEYEHSVSAWLVDSGSDDRWGYDLLLTMNSRREEDRKLFLATVRSASR